MKYWRIFWTCTLDERSDGFYYVWRNPLFKLDSIVFAGYNHKALRKKESTFKDALNLLP